MMSHGLPAAELSSMRTGLEDLARRVTVIAETLAAGPEDRAAQDLFQVERLLLEALRRLATLQTATRPQ